MIEQEAHVRTEIAWMRANLSEQAFRDWCKTQQGQQGQQGSWLDDFERLVLADRIERPGV